ncbi:hypothetical protein D3C78_1112260 [compost metagenome]
MAGADQGDLRVTGVAEQVAAATLALGLGDELVHVLHRVAGAAQLPGDVVQGAGLAHAPGLVAFELALGHVGEGRHLVHAVGDDLCRALGAVRRPVLVAAEVEILALVGGGQLFVGQRRQVGHGVAHLAEAPEHGLVVLQRLGVVERGLVGGLEHVAVHQAAGRLVDHHQFHALGLERIVQLLQAAVAGWRGVELGAQVFAGTEQPVALGLHQGGEVLLVAGGVAAGVVGLRAQLAARLGAEAWRLDLLGRRLGTDGEQGGGKSGKAQQLGQLWLHRIGFLSPAFRSGARPDRSARLCPGAPSGRESRPDARPVPRRN